jgi:hypothetical protein
MFTVRENVYPAGRNIFIGDNDVELKRFTTVRCVAQGYAWQKPVALTKILDVKPGPKLPKGVFNHRNRLGPVGHITGYRKAKINRRGCCRAILG